MAASLLIRRMRCHSHRPRVWTAVFLGVGLAAGIVVRAAEPGSTPSKVLSIDDLYRFDAPRNPALAPDGNRVAYARHWIDRQTKQERKSLWMAEGRAADARPVEKEEPDGRAPV